MPKAARPAVCPKCMAKRGSARAAEILSQPCVDPAGAYAAACGHLEGVLEFIELADMELCPTHAPIAIGQLRVDDQGVCWTVVNVTEELVTFARRPNPDEVERLPLPRSMAEAMPLWVPDNTPPANTQVERKPS